MSIKRFNEYKVNENSVDVTDEEKIEFLEKVTTALADLRTATFDLVYLWSDDSNYDIDLNEYLSGYFPRGWESYDEAQAATWIDASMPGIEAKIKELRGESTDTEGPMPE